LNTAQEALPCADHLLKMAVTSVAPDARADAVVLFVQHDA